MFHHSIRGNVDRRSFLRIGTASLMGLTLPRLLRAESNSTPTGSGLAKNVILIWLDGGPSTIDMWDPKPEAIEGIRGEFATIATSVPGVQICEHLPKVAQVLDRCTLLRSVTHGIPAHGPGAQYVLTGRLPAAATEYPSLGSVTAYSLRSESAVPAYVAFRNPNAGKAGHLGSAWNPFELDEEVGALPSGVSLGDDADREAFATRVQLRSQFDRRFDRFARDPLADGLNKFQQQAVDVLHKDLIRKALDVEQEPQERRESFGLRSPLGRNCLRACRLIEAGARFVTVGTTGWDTHANNFRELRNRLLPQLDRAIAALIAELESRGLLSTTIVCCCGEFGRTPNINDNAGRDHWSRAMSVLLAGGGFKAGYVHGATDSHGGEPIDGGCSPADLAATILQRLGIAPTSILKSSSGREMPIVPGGREIAAVLA